MVQKAEKTSTSDLTASPQARPEPGGYPEQTLALIGAAVAASKEAAHACRSEAGRECFEFALALLRESWIDSAPPRPSGCLRQSVSLRSAAESGQNARGAEKVIADVKWGLRLIAAVFEKAEGR